MQGWGAATPAMFPMAPVPGLLAPAFPLVGAPAAFPMPMLMPSGWPSSPALDGQGAGWPSSPAPLSAVPDVTAVFSMAVPSSGLPSLVGQGVDMCGDYKRGDCRRGDRCKYVHCDPPSGEGEKAPQIGPEAPSAAPPAKRQRREEAEPRPRTGKSPVPCKFFMQGNCIRGDQCTFTHKRPGEIGEDEDDPERQALVENKVIGRTPCKFFLAGNCIRGEACTFKHKPLVPEPGPEDDPEKFALVEKIKLMQKSSELLKQMWWTFCKSHGTQNYDPNRHEVPFLKTFVDAVESQTGMTPLEAQWVARFLPGNTLESNMASASAVPGVLGQTGHVESQEDIVKKALMTDAVSMPGGGISAGQVPMLGGLGCSQAFLHSGAALSGGAQFGAQDSSSPGSQDLAVGQLGGQNLKAIQTDDKKKNIPCRFFQRSYCSKGDQCPFSHEPLPDGAQLGSQDLASPGGQDLPMAELALLHEQDERRKNIPCKFWQRGQCSKGDQCTFSHEEPPGGLQFGLDNDPERISLVERIKTMQKSDGLQKQMWWQWCRSQGTQNFDPNRHHKPYLEAFLQAVHSGALGHMGNASSSAMGSLGTGAGPTAGEEDTEKKELIMKVKVLQRTADNGKQLWWNYCRARGNCNYDPNRHDSAFLRAFLAEAELSGCVPNPGAPGAGGKDGKGTYCKFYEEGTCYRGATCPYIHGLGGEEQTHIGSMQGLPAAFKPQVPKSAASQASPMTVGSMPFLGILPAAHSGAHAALAQMGKGGLGCMASAAQMPPAESFVNFSSMNAQVNMAFMIRGHLAS